MYVHFASYMSILDIDTTMCIATAIAAMSTFAHHGIVYVPESEAPQDPLEKEGM